MKTARSFAALLACCLLTACSASQAVTPPPAVPATQTQSAPAAPTETASAVPTPTAPATLSPSPEPPSKPGPVLIGPPVKVGNITYFWPLSIAGFELRRESSQADADGFILSFDDDQGLGISLRILGGTYAERDEYCQGQPANPATPVTVRGLEGCFPAATGAGFIVEWIENGTRYSVGGMGVSQELALATANNLEALDWAAFLARLAP